MTSSDNPLVLTMDGDKSLSANYSLNTYTLTVNATNGTVTKLPDQAAYDYDTVVQLTAVPATGYHFVNWTGDASGTELTTSVTMDGNRSVTANFAIDTFTLTYTAGTGGTISGLTPQTVNYGDDGTLVTAVPNTGWHFVDWSDGVLTASRTDLDVSANIAVTANFAIDTYTLAVTSDHGTIVKAPDLPAYDYGTSVTITATPAVGYAFTGWTGSVTSSDNPLVLTMDGDKSISANYSLNTYTLTVNATNGTVTKLPDQAVYDHDTVVQLTAVPATGYHFVNWTGDASGTELTTSVTMDGAKSVTANFAIDTFTLTYMAGTGGTISGLTPQTVNYGDDGTLVTAVPNTGWHFVDWSDGVLTASRTDLDVSANIAVTANFAIDTYTLAVTSDHGTITKVPDQATYDYGTSVTITATPAVGYSFTGWTGSVTSSDNPLVLTMDGDKSLTANFAIDTFTLTYTAGEGGAVTGVSPQTVNYGADGTLVTAVPNTGWHFVDWSDGVLTAARTDINVTANLSVTANFAIDTYTLTYTAGEGGSVTGVSPQTVNHGSDGTLVTAVPNTGWHFVDWSDGVLTAARTDINVTANLSVTANFAINTYTLTYTAGTGGSITGTLIQTVDYGGSGTLVTAEPSLGYHFVDWSDGVLTAARTDINVTANLSVTANFVIDTYALTITRAGLGTGTISSSPAGIDCGAVCSGSFDYGTIVLLTATPSASSSFTGWSGDYTGTENPLQITMDGAKTLQATFATLTYTISGTVTAGGSPLSGVTMAGLPGSPVTDGTGAYSATVDYGASFTVTPTHSYYTFDPASQTYTNVTANITDQNYDASLIASTQRQALIAFYNSTNGDGWVVKSGWKTPPLYPDGFAMPGTEGSWLGLTVVSGTVTGISLYNNNLSGTIPPELGNLTGLQTLQLGYDPLTGTISSEWANLTNLQTLYISYTQLSGTIPSWLGTLNHLSTLRLEGNQLSGTIPSELGNLAGLRMLYLSENQLSGSIPPDLGNLTLLEGLTLDSNQLTGTIPPELGNLTSLTHLILRSNQLSGSIPPALGNLPNVQGLYLNSNQLSGMIPAELGNLSTLSSLWLNSNQLTGSIPAELGNIPSLQNLYLNSNRLSGPIPVSLANLTRLSSSYTDFGYNALYTSDAALIAFLNSKDPDWASTQTIAPASVTADVTRQRGHPCLLAAHRLHQ